MSKSEVSTILVITAVFILIIWSQSRTHKENIQSTYNEAYEQGYEDGYIAAKIEYGIE